MKKSFSFSLKRSVSLLISIALFSTLLPANFAIAEDTQTTPVEQTSSTLSTPTETAPAETTSEPAPAPPPTEEITTTTPPVTTSPAPGTVQIFDPKSTQGQNLMAVEPDAQTGALTISYPFTLPAGRNNLTPNLAINYNSQNEDNFNLSGFGWAISIPTIERIARKGVDKLYTENYFNSSLSGELKPVSLSDGSHGTYGAETESGAFLNYEFTTDNQWTVKDKNGNVYYFGQTTSSRLDNPSDSSKVAKWMLSKIEDANGNGIKYEYNKDSAQVYPSSIKYSTSAANDGIYEVAFTFSDRLDKMKSYGTGFLVTTNKRLSRIETRTNGNWTRRYDLAYSAGNNKSRSILSSITETARDESGNTSTMPVTTFEYTSGQAGWELDPNYAIPEYFYAGSSNDYSGVRLMEVNGDGYVDIVKASSPTEKKVYLNKADGTGWDINPNYTIPVTFYCGDGWCGTKNVSGDFNSDGLEDIMDSQASNQKVYLNTGEFPGWEETLDFNVGFQLCSNCYGGSGLRTFDINGDGLMDFVMSESDGSGTKWVRINKGDNTGWELAPTYTIPLYFHVYDPPEEKGGVQLFDANGDGLTDIVVNSTIYIRGENGVYQNKGDSTGWNQDLSWTVPVRFYSGSNWHRSVRVSDVNGDGIVDILQSNGPDTGVYIGNGTSWTKDTAYTIPASFCYPGCENYPWGTYLVDVNADSLPDIVESNYYNSTSTKRVFINKSTKPDLLKKVHYSSGSESTITYKPTTAYKSGSALDNPKLPINVYTVSSITTDDGFGNTSTNTYEYEGGQYFYNNPYDRKFAGFAKVTKIDPDNNKTVQFFHQGNESSSQFGEYQDQKSKINLVYRAELYDSNNNLFQLTLNKWDKADLGNERTFVFKSQTIQKDYDGDSDHRDRAQTFSYNSSNGNLTQAKNLGEVAANDDGTFSDISGDTSTVDYTYTTGNLSLVSSELLKDNSGTKKSETKYYYDGLAYGSATLGNTTKQENWITGTTYATTQAAYNSYGLTTSETDPRGNITTYTYDANNLLPTTVKNALNQTTTITYDYSSGKPLTITDANGAKLSYTYDAFDRLLTGNQSDFSNPATLVLKTDYTYNDNFPRSVTQKNYLDNTNHANAYFYYDGLGRVIQERAEAESTNFSVKDTLYNSRGLVQKTSLPYFSSGSARTNPTTQNALYTSFVYDAIGRPTQVADATGTVQNSYDQWALTTTDQLNHKKDFKKDAYDRLAQVTEYNNSNLYNTTYTYDALGNLTRLTDALGNLRNFTYDALSRRTKSEDLHAPADATFGIWNYTYDAAGNITTAKDPRDMTATYTYDALNRQLTEDSSGTAFIEFTNTYDTCENGKGQLCTTSMGDGTFNFAYAYFPLGLQKSETKQISTLTNQSTSFSYDRLGNPLTITYPDATKAAYTYDSAGQLETVTTKLSNQSVFQPLINSLEYSPLGQTTKLTYANGTVTTNTYDQNALYRLTQKLTTKGTQKLQKLDYTIDPVGNITKIVDSSDTVPVGPYNSSLAKTSNFTYDDLYRLTSATITGAVSGQNYTQTFAYDALGNITGKSGLGTYLYQGNTGTNYANPHAVTAIGTQTYTYDKSGNVTADNAWNYTWSYRGLMTSSVTKPLGGAPYILIGYKYDAAGNRILKTTGGTKLTYYINQYYDLEGTQTKRHIYAGSEKVATIDGPVATATTAYHHADHLSGSSVETNQTGSVLQLTDYHPYGTTRFERTASAYTGNDYKFTGKEKDDSTGLYYYGARYYNPSLGRFMSEDPWEGNITDPQSLNKYAYVRNNPLKYRDPTGMCLEDACIVEGIIILSAYIASSVIATQHRSSDSNSTLPDLFDNRITLEEQAKNQPLTTPLTPDPTPNNTAHPKDNASTYMDDPLATNMILGEGPNILSNPYDTSNQGNGFVTDNNAPESVKKQIPSYWGEGEAAKKEGGWIWTDPQNSYNEIRYSPGQPDSKQPGQQVDNVKNRVNGQYKDANGNTAPKQSQESHIPVDQFKYSN
ncbi:MAG: RHS repeat-associated core domain-containing protein [Candidatus Gracilibacteria bacterium]